MYVFVHILCVIINFQYLYLCIYKRKLKIIKKFKKDVNRKLLKLAEVIVLNELEKENLKTMELSIQHCCGNAKGFTNHMRCVIIFIL